MLRKGYNLCRTLTWNSGVEEQSVRPSASKAAGEQGSESVVTVIISLSPSPLKRMYLVKCDDGIGLDSRRREGKRPNAKTLTALES